MSEEQKLRENVKSREVVPRDNQRSNDRKQSAEQRPKGASGGQNRKRSGKQQARPKPQSSAGSTEVQGERRERTNQQKKRRPRRKSENPKAPQREVPVHAKGDGQQRTMPRDVEDKALDRPQENKQARGEAQNPDRNRRTEKADTPDKSPRGDRPRRDRKKRFNNDLDFRAEETVEDIARDITRIEKDIQIDIDSIRNQKLDL